MLSNKKGHSLREQMLQQTKYQNFQSINHILQKYHVFLKHFKLKLKKSFKIICITSKL